VSAGPARFARLERVFQRSSALTPAEREALLLWECGEDAEMRALAQRLLHGDAEQVEAAEAVRIQGFRVLEELGHGAMGAVYVAEQEGLGRRVALKVLRADSAGERELARFRREVRALARLDHPGIARVLASGVQSTPLGPRPWFAMALVEGRRLTEVARELDLYGLARLFASLADALHAAHAAGIVHRDLKPANVLVDARGHPVVVDFGIAAIQGDGTADSLRTEPGSLLGTLATMSPEQTRDTSVDARADIYALGAMLYELATGRAAIPVGDCDLAEALRRIREDEPPCARRTAGVPRDLATILATALAKEPERRYATAADLAEDLRRFADHRLIRARPTPLHRRLLKVARRNRALCASIGAVILALGIGLAAASVALARARRAEERTRAERAETQLHYDILLAAQLHARLGDPFPAGPEELEVLKRWIRLGEDLQARLPADREVAARADAITLAGLDGVQRLFAPGPGERGFEDLKRLRDLAQGLHENSIDMWRARWEQVRAAIANPLQHPQYHGLKLPPQLGLVPLGPDPDSHLEEFACVGPAGELAQRDPATGRVRPEPGQGLVLVLIPGGDVEVGHQAEDPAAPFYDASARPHEGVLRVALEPFFLSKFEVTQGQWNRVMGPNPSYWAIQDHWEDYLITELHPVEQVDWDDATHFAERQRLTLPTEVQFEFAQRAGTRTPWWTGETAESLRGAEAVTQFAPEAQSPEQEPMLRTLRAGIHLPVGTFRPNPYGIYDLSGNVAEWCRDVFWVDAKLAPPRTGDGMRARPDAKENAENPHRSMRGGSHADPPPVLASGHRNDDVRSSAGRALGFRVARPLDPKERSLLGPAEVADDARR
jgi:formylglycine-generating enzyme required for sulfatase activity/predicted Ser/Thr protein kinase